MVFKTGLCALGLIKNFSQLDKHSFVVMHIIHVRPQIEYCTQPWHPYKRHCMLRKGTKKSNKTGEKS